MGKTFFPSIKKHDHRKHPHGRGEDYTQSHKFTRMQETPPRAWGRPAGRGRGGRRVRNTPTGVGKTRHLTKKKPPPRKHPHGRGEDVSALPAASSQEETPPRAWGRHALVVRLGSSVRNTPTGVGKTRVCTCGGSLRQKHPHGRGEDQPIRKDKDYGIETPPRAWGRQPPQVRRFYGEYSIFFQIVKQHRKNIVRNR